MEPESTARTQIDTIIIQPVSAMKPTGTVPFHAQCALRKSLSVGGGLDLDQVLRERVEVARLQLSLCVV